MTLRTKVAEALKAELIRQGDCSAVVGPAGGVREGRVYCGFDVDPEALADAALEARKRWHQATDPGAK